MEQWANKLKIHKATKLLPQIKTGSRQKATLHTEKQQRDVKVAEETGTTLTLSHVSQHLNNW